MRQSPGTLVSLLRARAAEAPAKVAIRFKSRGLWHDVTWRELEERVAAQAVGLRDAGVAPGTCVAIVADASPSWLSSILAVHSLGAWPLSLYQGLGADEVSHIFSTVSIATLIVDGLDWLAVLEARRVRAPERVILDSTGAAPSTWGGRAVATLETIEASGRDRMRADQKIWESLATARTPDDPALLVTTAGTAGMPRVIAHSSSTLLEAARRVVAEMGDPRPLGPKDAIVLELPTGHMGAVLVSLMLPVLTGIVAHLGEPELAAEATRDVCPTVSIAFGRIWELQAARVELAARLAKGLRRRVFRWAEASRRTSARAADSRARRSPRNAVGASLSFALVFIPLLRKLGLERMRQAIVLGAVAPQIVEQWRAWGVELRPAYGLAETGPVVARLAGSSITAARGVELSVDPTGGLLVRTGSLHRGVLEGTAIRPVQGDGGWFRSGDLAAGTKDKPILLGRGAEDAATRGARPFASAAVQAALRSSPYIRAAAVMRTDNGDVTALIDLNLDTVVRWGSSVALSYSTPASLRASHEVLALISDEVARVNTWLVRNELPAITSIAISPVAFAVGRELSPTYDVRLRRITLPAEVATVGARA